MSNNPEMMASGFRSSGGENGHDVLESATAELKALNQALTDSERRLRVAISNGGIGLWVWNSTDLTNSGDWSPRLKEIMGMPVEAEVTHERFLARVHPDDRERVNGAVMGALAGANGGDYACEYRILHPDDDSPRWVTARGQAFFDAAGRPLRFIGTVIDVTERKRAEESTLRLNLELEERIAARTAELERINAALQVEIEERKQAEEMLRRSERSLAEGQRLTKTGTWILDFTTGNTDWSVETCRIFGFADSPPSPHYSEFRARVHPDDREAVDRGLRESFETGEPRPLGYRFLLPDGTRKFIETISEPVKDETGEVLKLMGTIMDVTERRHAEDALQSSEILARGQLNALTRTLEALVAEPEPDRFLEHVLRTITEQLGAHSSSIWRKDVSTGLMEFECAFEGGRLVTDSTAKVAALDPMQPLPGISFPRGATLTGRTSVLDDISDAPASQWRDYLISQGVVTVLFVPTAIAGQVEGVISIRFSHRRMFCTGELELAQALANQAMLALQLMRLSRESRQAAVVAERNRMARDIHDTLAQGFTGVIMQLQAAKGAAARGTMADAAAHIARAEELARTSLGEARNSVRALRPRSLRDGTLCRALEDLLKRVADDANITAEFRVEGEPHTMPMEWEEDLLRIAQESLTNTIKHARATVFRATLAFGKKQTCLHLADDGHGFDPQHEHDGLGLIGMQERVNLLGGRFIVHSGSGRGTEISVILSNSPFDHDHA